MRKLHYLFIALCVAGCQAASDITPEATPLLHTKASSLEFSRTESLNLTDLDIIHPTKIIRADSLFVILTPKAPTGLPFTTPGPAKWTALSRQATGQGKACTT